MLISFTYYLVHISEINKAKSSAIMTFWRFLAGRQKVWLGFWFFCFVFHPSRIFNGDTRSGKSVHNRKADTALSLLLEPVPLHRRGCGVLGRGGGTGWRGLQAPSAYPRGETRRRGAEAAVSPSISRKLRDKGRDYEEREKQRQGRNKRLHFFLRNQDVQINILL